MASGNHFQVGVSLAPTNSFTPTDVDTSTVSIRVAATRGLLFIRSTAPTISDTPDWANMLWAKPVTHLGEDAYELRMYSLSLTTWILALAGLPDLANGVIPVYALAATLLQVGMVPVVTNVGGTAVVQWQIFTPTNIPIGSIVPGSPNSILGTNTLGTGLIYNSLATWMSIAGRVVQFSNISITGVTPGQVLSFNGSTWVPTTPYTPTAPEINSAAWTPSSYALEVWDSPNARTVRKSRKNMFDTLFQDYAYGALALTTSFLGFINGAVEATLFTIENIRDAISPSIISQVLTQISGVYPKRFVSSNYEVSAAAGWGMGTPVAGIAHGLGAVPTKFGFKVIRTDDAGGSSSVILVNYIGAVPVAVNDSFDGAQTGFRTGVSGGATQLRFLIKADSTKLYLIADSSTNTNSFANAFYVALGDWSVQLYAYQ